MGIAMRETSKNKLILLYLWVTLLVKSAESLKHHLVLTDDNRYQVSVSSFGYNKNGRLEVIVRDLSLAPDISETDSVAHYGFVMVKSDQAKSAYAAKPFQRTYAHPSPCLLNDPRNAFRFDLMALSILPQKKEVRIECSGEKVIFPRIQTLPHRPDEDPSLHSAFKHEHNKRAAGIVTNETETATIPEQRIPKTSSLFHKCPNSDSSLPLEITTDANSRQHYAFNFSMFIKDLSEEGTYYLSFQNCHGVTEPSTSMNAWEMERLNEIGTRSIFNMSMLITETNYPAIYLSAGAIPLPQMYFMLSVMFFLSGGVWLNFLSKQKENMLKIHTLMTVLVFAKACSLLFHGMNYHYIAQNGQPVVTWAYLYYATRSVKGALFFITLALISSGWTVVKHILSPVDKKYIASIVILQIIAHIGEIMEDESSEGEYTIEFWAKLCGLIDLTSCIAILILMSRSMKHLQEASTTDGKAALNLKKMELFKSFYVVSTIYIYVTRIATYALLSMVDYKYLWLPELFSELATLIYFVITGYYFQPLPTNPYLLLSTDNDQEEDILFSVDAQEMNGTRIDDLEQNSQDKGALLGDDADKTRRTRRLPVIEEFV